MQFILLGAFGLRDPIRPGVKAAVAYARGPGHMAVRLISGDHLETATAVARKVGILTTAEAG